jgi:ADP-ribose pyrophosphatase
MNILNVEKLTDEKWLNLFAATYEHNGHTGRWVFASRRQKPHGTRQADAVVIVPLLRNPGEPTRLVLIREFRVPAGGYLYGFPAGLLEPGESVEDTVRRELREETGLELTAIRRVSPPLFSTSGMSDEAAALAFVEVRGGAAARAQLEASEDIAVVLLDYAGVRRLCDDPDAWMDTRVWLVLYLYEQLGRLP